MGHYNKPTLPPTLTKTLPNKITPIPPLRLLLSTRKITPPSNLTYSPPIILAHLNNTNIINIIKNPINKSNI